MPDLNFAHRVNPELVPGARNAIQICLRLQPNERITIITDEATQEIAAALQAEVEQVGSESSLFVLEHHANRPMTSVPKEILADLATSQVSIYAAQSQPGELSTRSEITSVANQHGIRHAHMVGINTAIMCAGMRADFHQIDELSQRLVERARLATRIRCTTPGGTDFEAEFSPELHWLKTSGIIQPEKWGNLPGGEILTSPLNTNGVFVVDGVVGDYLCAQYGDLEETPLTIEVEDSRIRSLRCDNEELREDFRRYTTTDENSNRVGEFAIGTNVACTKITGNILQDEKIPGVHIAFGDPYCDHTGAKWLSETHIDCVGRKFDIWFDDEQIMRGGNFLL